MVLNKTSNKLTRAANESLKATERWAEVGMEVLEEFLAFIKFII